MNTDLTLVLLAAGRGSRFGGPKQLEPVGPNDEPVFAITAQQAVNAGFSRLVLVTTTELLGRLEAAVDRFVTGLAVDYVLQDVQQPAREVPWGTGHAVAACADVVTTPFGVANGDDLYGDPSFHLLAQYLRNRTANTACIVSFELHRVLSDVGGVSRGVCEVDANGGLISVTETHELQRGSDDTGEDLIVDAERNTYDPHTQVSMNLWGLGPEVLSELRERFGHFLVRAGDDPKVEFQLPTELSAIAAEGQLSISVVPSSGRWVGLTHRAELPAVRAEVSTWA